MGKLAGHNRGQERRSQQPFQSLAELDPREEGRRTSDGLTKANTTAGPHGFLVGTFEGFKAQPFVTEVPNLALEGNQDQHKTGGPLGPRQATK